MAEGPSPRGEDRAATDESVITFSDVSKVFMADKRTTEAVKGISFRISRGIIAGLIGPDAAGKTTTMRLAAGLLKPDRGQITVLGNDSVKSPLAIQESVSYMPQRFGLYEDLTTQENLDLYADLQGVPQSERAERYEKLMRMTGLADFTKRLAGRLSGGMKQKLGLACSLLGSARLLLLDEPTVGVDPLSRRELWNIVYGLVEREQTTVLLSTAYLSEAERCAHIVMMHDGRLLGEGTPEDFKKKVRGRTFLASVAGMKNRLLQEKMAGVEGVVDAVVQADRVRLVMAEAKAPPVASAAGEGREVKVDQAEARFEDSFVDMLRRLNGHAGRSAGVASQSPGEPTGERDEVVIQVEDLRRRFGDFYAVKGITFEVHAGEIFGLLGANGAGKSTTFRMLCGLLPPSEGHLKVAGVDLRHAAATARQKIGYMSQKFSLYGDLSVRENLRFFSSAYGLWGRRRAERTRWALEEFDLEERAEVNSADLSLGHKQRLAMACSLMHQPEILFLDEPTSGVDPLARREFWGRIDGLAEGGVTVLVTTHFLEEAEYCDRLAIMAAGRLLTIGTPNDVRQSARSEENPEPTIEDAFVRLIEQDEAKKGGAEANG